MAIVAKQFVLIVAADRIVIKVVLLNAQYARVDRTPWTVGQYVSIQQACHLDSLLCDQVDSLRVNHLDSLLVSQP
jgi:hypothetical protein